MDLSWKLLSVVLLLSITATCVPGLPQGLIPTKLELSSDPEPQTLLGEVNSAEEILAGEEKGDSVVDDELSAPLVDEASGPNSGNEPGVAESRVDIPPVDEVALIDQVQEDHIDEPVVLLTDIEGVHVDEPALSDEAQETLLNEPVVAASIDVNAPADELTLSDEAQENLIDAPVDVSIIEGKAPVDEPALSKYVQADPVNAPIEASADAENAPVDEPTLSDEAHDNLENVPVEVPIKIETAPVDEPTLINEGQENPINVLAMQSLSVENAPVGEIALSDEAQETQLDEQGVAPSDVRKASVDEIALSDEAQEGTVNELVAEFADEGGKSPKNDQTLGSREEQDYPVDDPLVASSGEEEKTEEEIPAALDVIQKRVDMTQEIRPCVGRALETRTLVLNCFEAMDSVITFQKEDSFVLVDLPHLQISDAATPSFEFELNLQFRTDLPRGLLAFLRVDADDPRKRVHFYLYLHQGHLAAASVVGGNRLTVVSQLGGLHDGQFHTVQLSSLCQADQLTVTVDEEQMTLQAVGLSSILAEAVSKDLQHVSARLWLGGVDPVLLHEEQPKMRVLALHGCLQHVQLLQPHAPAADGLATLLEEEEDDLLTPSSRRGVISGETCKDICIESSPCPAEARCVNHYSHAVCDCSDLEKQHKECGVQDFRMVRLSGGEYVTHRTQSWENRGHKKAHKVSFFFKTTVNDSVLLFVRSLFPKETYFAIALDAEGKLRAGGSPSHLDFDIKLDQVELEFGSGQLSPKVLTDDQWHKVVLKAHKNRDTIDIDPVVYFGYAPDFNQACLLPVYTGDLRCSRSEKTTASEMFYFDPASSQCKPAQYTGCGGNANKFITQEQCEESCSITGLPSYRPYEGCLHRVYVDGVDVLANQHTPARVCDQVDKPTLSLTTSRSHVLVPSDKPYSRSNLFLKLQFKSPAGARGVLAQGSVQMPVADTVDKWMVVSNNNSQLTFLLGENLLTVTSQGKVNHDDWNLFSLRINNADVTLTLNEGTTLGTSDIAFDLISGVTLGGKRAALQSCLRDLEIDGTSLDLRYFLDEEHGVVSDACAMAGPCEAKGACLNGGACSLSTEGKVHCDCSGTEHHGSRCQFALFPRSCEGYARLGYNTSGMYHVDLDGPGPSSAVPVHCHFSRKGALTEVAHGLPEKLDVRKKGMKNYKLQVNYEGMSDHDLINLVDASTSCRQNVTFDCVRSRLKLSSETWFSSPRMKLNTHFGSGTPGICPCQDIDECDKKSVVCNCDLNDGLRRRDTGYIRTPEQLPVTGVYFINDPGSITDKSRAQLSLGSLQCFKQAEAEDAISMLDTESFLEYTTSKSRESLRSIHFAFRTSATEALLLHKPSYHPLQADLRVILTSERCLEVQYKQRSEHHTVKFHSLAPLNTASWQYILIDFSQQQIQVSLNGASKLMNLGDGFKLLGGELYFGGSPKDLYGSIFEDPVAPGFIGCLKDFFVNEERVTVQELLRHSPLISHKLGCKLSCDPNRCQNGAQCNELPAGEFECVCRNKFAESGDRCEISLNDDSITLLSTDTEMRYKDELKPVSEDWNPLSQDLTFGFRTRQLQGLILFMLDNIQNLIQIHLSKPNEVTLLWNTGYTLRSMIVNTGNLALNRGKLVQLRLKRDVHDTTLSLLSEGQLFSNSTAVGVKLLQERQYQQFPFGSEVPHADLTSYEHTPSLQSSFLRVLVGGAESGSMHGKVPGFTGCLSGLRIGSHAIRLTDRSIWTWSHNNYELGCYSPCELNDPCQNNGACLDVFMKNKELLTECDCAATSYMGDLCDQEIAYRFHGEEYLIFKELYNVFSQSFSLDFAFALDNEQEQPDEDDSSLRTILLFRDAPDNLDDLREESQYGLLAVGLRNSADVLTVLVQWPDSSVNPEGKIIEFDMADFQLDDGFRHHVTASLDQRVLSITVDDTVLTMKSSSPLEKKSSPSLEALVVGGSGDHPAELPTGAEAWAPFVGCISNVQVRTADKKVYRPLEDYDTHANNTEAFTRVGLPYRTQCSKFRPAVLDDVEGSGVDHRHGVKTLEVETEEFQPLQQEEQPYNDASGIKTAGKIGGLIVGAVALGTFIYVCKITHKGDPKPATDEYGFVASKEKSTAESTPAAATASSSSSSSSSSKEAEPLLKESVELQEMRTASNASHPEVKYLKETPNTTSPEPRVATKGKVIGASEEAKSIETPPGSSPAPPATIIVEKPADESTPVDAKVQQARDALDLLDPKELEKSYTKLSESCEDVFAADQTPSEHKGTNVVEGDEEASVTPDNKATKDSEEAIAAPHTGVHKTSDEAGEGENK